MSNRTWIYDTLLSSTEATDWTTTGTNPPRIFPAERFRSIPKKPFITYREGNTSPDNDVPSARRQYFTIYLHDEAEPGDYMGIDSIMDAVIDIFTNAPADPEQHIIAARWLETSADQDDKEMETISRYIRFQLIRSTWT